MANEFPGGVLVFGAANRTGVPTIPEAGGKSKCDKSISGWGLPEREIPRIWQIDVSSVL